MHTLRKLASPHLGTGPHAEYSMTSRCRVFCPVCLITSKAGLTSTPGSPPGPVVGKIGFYDMPQHLYPLCVWDLWARVDPEHVAALRNILRTVELTTGAPSRSKKAIGLSRRYQALDAQCRICEMTVHTA